MPDSPPVPSIDGYRFDERGLLGEGAFGEVWRAVDTAGQPRAVKVFKQGALKRDLWRAEFEKLRALDEPPGIVTLYDQGKTSDGRPFVAMRLLADEDGRGGWRGRTLRDRIERDDLDLESRWAILFQLADTLAYLHRQGVHHCDVKPSNVLLTAGDEPRPVLCDFGQSLDDGFVPLVASGTYLYACPEQLMNRMGGTGSWDVYSFGVTAYQLLSGRLPRMESLASDLRTRAPEAVLEETMQSMGDSLSFGESLDRDLLPKIMAEAVQKESTIQDLGLDERRGEVEVIKRCLALRGQRPPRFENMEEVVAAFSNVEKRRVVSGEKRQKSIFAILTAVGLATSCLAAWQWAKARTAQAEAEGFARNATAASVEQERLAKVAEERRQEADALRLQAESEAERAVASEAAERDARGTAERLINSMLYDLKNQLEPIGRVDLLDQVSREAEVYFSSLPENKRTAASARENSTMLNNRGEVLLAQGKIEEAILTLEQARFIRAGLVEKSPGDKTRVRDLSVTLERLGDAHLGAGQLEEARRFFSSCLEMRESSFETAPSRGAQRDIAIALGKTADVTARLGDLEKALTLSNISLGVIQKLGAKAPPPEGLQREIASAHVLVGDLLRETGKIEEATFQFGEAQVILEKLRGESADDRSVQGDMAALLLRQGELKLDQRDAEGASVVFQGAVDLLRPLAEADSENLERSRGVALALTKLGTALAAEQNPKAQTHFEESGKIHEVLLGRPIVSATWLADGQGNLNALGDFFERSGDLPAAERAFQKSLTLARRQADVAPSDSATEHLVVALYKAGLVGEKVEKERGRVLLEEALELLTENSPPGFEEWKDVIRAEL